MVQKIGAQYLAKKIADQMLNPSPAAQPTNVEQGQSVQAANPSASSRGLGPEVLSVTDANGRQVNAYRVADVSIYVVASPQSDRASELEHGITESDTKIFFHHENGKLAGVIYAPSRSQMLGDLHGGRADEV